MTALSSPTSNPKWRSLLWRFPGRFLYRTTFHNWYEIRRLILLAFGANVQPGIKFRRTVDIDRPWNLHAGKMAMVGDHAVLRCRAPISLGAETTISQMTVLCTELLDPFDEELKTRVAPITVGNQCWIAADSLVSPGVKVNDGAVVGARSLVEEDVPAWTVAAGQPATNRHRRQIKPSSTSEREKGPFKS